MMLPKNFIVIMSSQRDFEEVCEILKPDIKIKLGIKKLMKYKNDCIRPCITHRDYMLPTITMEQFRDGIKNKKD